MLKIKLARFGKKKQPEYRIVINEARSKRDGKYIESIGYYKPTGEKVLTLDLQAYQKWVKKGAQPTDTVRDLLERSKKKNPFPPRKTKLSKKAQAKLAAEKETKEVKEEKPAAEEVTKEKEIKEDEAKKEEQSA